MNLNPISSHYQFLSTSVEIYWTLGICAIFIYAKILDADATQENLERETEKKLVSTIHHKQY